MVQAQDRSSPFDPTPTLLMMGRHVQLLSAVGRGRCESAGSRDHMSVDHTISERHEAYCRYPVVLKPHEIPDAMKKAIIAVEDKRFMDHASER
jgi:hypothetical protein